MKASPTSLTVVLSVLLALAGVVLLAQTEEKTVDGDALDHIVLLVPERSPARFLGPDVHVEEIRYTVQEEGEGDGPRVEGTISFGRRTKLAKQLQKLLEQSRTFDLVIYVLAGSDLERLRLDDVKLTSGEKLSFAWTAAGLRTQIVPASSVGP